MSSARHARVRWVLGQAVVVVLGVAIYFGVRGHTVGAFAVAERHAWDLVDLERAWRIDVESALQSLVVGSPWRESVANDIYIYGHWPVIAVTMLWLALRHRPQFLRLRDGMILSGLVGMVVFASYPVVPPRLLSGLGLADTVTQRSEAYRVLQPPTFVNQYAAMPSLHAGWDLLVGIAIVTATSSVLLRVVGCAMPLLMGLATVVTANHYVIDVAAGIALVLVADRAAVAIGRRRRLAAAVPAPEPDQAPDPDPDPTTGPAAATPVRQETA